MVVYRSRFAGVAELADARDLKSREVKLVPVRARSPAPEFSRLRVELGDFFVTYQLSCVGVDAGIAPYNEFASHANSDPYYNILCCTRKDAQGIDFWIPSEYTVVRFETRDFGAF